MKNSPNGQRFAVAIQDAMDKVAAEVGGDMNAALGALVGVQAYLIAGVTDRKHRRALIAAIERQLPEQIAAQMKLGETARTVAFEMKGPLN